MTEVSLQLWLYYLLWENGLPETAVKAEGEPNLICLLLSPTDWNEYQAWPDLREAAQKMIDLRIEEVQGASR